MISLSLPLEVNDMPECLVNVPINAHSLIAPAWVLLRSLLEAVRISPECHVGEPVEMKFEIEDLEYLEYLEIIDTTDNLVEILTRIYLEDEIITDYGRRLFVDVYADLAHNLYVRQL